MDKKEIINKGVMLLSQKEVGEYLSLTEVITAVEKAYVQFSEGVTIQPPIVNLMLEDRDGEVDVKTAFIDAYNMIGVKIAAGFYKNEARFGVPSWPSIMTLADGETGFPIAVMDGGYITTVRTGAAGAVGAKYLARQESETVLIVGAGNQARAQLRSLKVVLPKLSKVVVYSPFEGEVEAYISDMAPTTRLSIEGLTEYRQLAEAANRADVIVTVTPAREPLVKREWIKPGTHINAIGSDGPGKQELDPCILRDGKVVADSFKQTSLVGECQHAIKEGFMGLDGRGLWAEIGEIISGKKAGRENDEEITVFDATGMAVLDVAAATIVYNRALKEESTRYFQMIRI